MVRWLKTVWADARKSGEWMADAMPSGRPLPRYARYARWFYRWEIPIDAMFWLAFTAFLVLFTLLALIAVLVARFA